MGLPAPPPPGGRSPVPPPAGSQVVPARVAGRPREGSSGPLPAAPRAPRNFPDAGPPLGAGERGRGSWGEGPPRPPPTPRSPSISSDPGHGGPRPGLGPAEPGPAPPQPARPSPPLPGRRGGGRGGALGSVSASGTGRAAEGGRAEGTLGRGLGVRASLELVPGEHSAPIRLAGARGAGWGRGLGPSARRLPALRTRRLGARGSGRLGPPGAAARAPGPAPPGPSLLVSEPESCPFPSRLPGTCPAGRADNLGLRGRGPAQTGRPRRTWVGCGAGAGPGRGRWKWDLPQAGPGNGGKRGGV